MTQFRQTGDGPWPLRAYARSKSNRAIPEAEDDSEIGFALLRDRDFDGIAAEERIGYLIP